MGDLACEEHKRRWADTLGDRPFLLDKDTLVHHYYFPLFIYRCLRGDEVCEEFSHHWEPNKAFAPEVTFPPKGTPDTIVDVDSEPADADCQLAGHNSSRGT